MLDPACVAYHQLVTFAPARPELAAALERSPLFRVTRVEAGTVAEWIQFSPESDPSPFPLGRISVWPGGVLLEAFSERRMDVLRSCLRDVGAGEVPADQIRVFRVPDAIANPQSLLQPLHEIAGEPLTGREIALTYLRMAWPYFPREELRGRTPQAVLKTGRGRAAVETLLDSLPRALRRDIPVFPAFGVDDLHDALLPREASPPGTSAEDSHSKSQARED